MFGRNWESAEGKCINVRYKGGGNMAKTANDVWYLMEVQPSAGEPFRVEVQPPPLMMSFRAPPMSGRTVRMKCNSSHTKAKFDRTDPIISKKADEQALKAQFQAELHHHDGR
jgi:hypothetical protein